LKTRKDLPFTRGKALIWFVVKVGYLEPGTRNFGFRIYDFGFAICNPEPESWIPQPIRAKKKEAEQDNLLSQPTKCCDYQSINHQVKSNWLSCQPPFLSELIR
jgi:hypothetical protein